MTRIDELRQRLAGRWDSNDRLGINIESTGQMDRNPEANRKRVFPIKKNELAYMDEQFTTNLPPVRVETFSNYPETALSRKHKGKVGLNAINLKRGRHPPDDSPLGEKLEDAAVERKLFKKRGTKEGDFIEGNTTAETFTEKFMRKHGPKGLRPPRETPTVGRFSRGTISLENAQKWSKLKTRLARIYES